MSYHMRAPEWMMNELLNAAYTRIAELEQERDRWKAVATLYSRVEFTALLHQRALSAEEHIEEMERRARKDYGV